MENYYNPLVSIIIPVYNGEKYIKNAINSALNQKYNNIEIIVVNDGSTDKTALICEKYKAKIKILNKENGGVSSALNLGIANMQGEYFSWLSHDDEYSKNKIYNQVKLINNLKDFDSIVFSNSKKFFCKGLFNLNVKIEKILNKNYVDNKWILLLFTIFSGCTFLIPKKYLELNNFNEELKVTQDYDLWLKFCNNYNFIFDKSISTWVRIHSLQGSLNYNEKNWIELDNLWLNILESFEKTDIFLKNKIFFYIYLYKNPKCRNMKKWIENKIKIDNKNIKIYKNSYKEYMNIDYLFFKVVKNFFFYKITYLMIIIFKKIKIGKK
ncbi:MAG: glycosyltransferase family 2 protein [Mycoplasmoidaceae bacterium]